MVHPKSSTYPRLSPVEGELEWAGTPERYTRIAAYLSPADVSEIINNNKICFFIF